MGKKFSLPRKFRSPEEIKSDFIYLEGSMPTTNNSANYSPTQYAVQAGGSNGTLTDIAPSATVGYAILSNGSSATPSFQNIYTNSFIPITSVTTTPYTVLSTDYFLSVTTTSSITIKLPNAPSTGKVWVIKDKTGLSNVFQINVTTVGGTVTIDGGTTYVISGSYESINVVFDGTNYEVF